MSHRTRAILRASLLVPAAALFAACSSAPTGPSAPSNLKSGQVRHSDGDPTGRPCSEYDQIPAGYECRAGFINPNG